MKTKLERSYWVLFRLKGGVFDRWLGFNGGSRFCERPVVDVIGCEMGFYGGWEPMILIIFTLNRKIRHRNEEMMEDLKRFTYSSSWVGPTDNLILKMEKCIFERIQLILFNLKQSHLA